MPQATAVSLIEFNLSFTQWRENSTKLWFTGTDRTFPTPAKHIYSSKNTEYLFKILIFFFLFCLYLWKGDKKKHQIVEDWKKFTVNREKDKSKRCSTRIFTITPLGFFQIDWRALWEVISHTRKMSCFSLNTNYCITDNCTWYSKACVTLSVCAIRTRIPTRTARTRTTGASQ